MSYTPTTWSTGDTITATALNKMENGIANAGGGYDALINVTYRDNPVLVSGTFSDVMAKVRQYLPVDIRLVSDYGDGHYFLETIFDLDAEFIPSEYGETNEINIKYARGFTHNEAVKANVLGNLTWTESGVTGSVGW